MKHFLRFLQYTGLALAALVSASLIYLSVDKKLSEHAEHKRSDILTPDGIDSLEKWRIGGIDQYVLIRGQNRANPVLVFLHGGPGSAQIGMARGLDAELEKDFTVVQWDQRGSGKTFSFFTSADSFAVEQFLSDALEVVEKSKERLGKKKVFLVGHSWGSYLAAVTAHRHPEHLYAYAGIGQMVNSLENEQVSLEFVLAEARSRQNETALRELESIGRPPYAGLREVGIQRKWLGEFGGAMFYGPHRLDGYSYLGKFMWSSPEYTLPDQLFYFAGIFRTLTLFMPRFYTLDLYTQAPEISVPVRFLHGRHDYNTPFTIMQKYYALLKCSNKKIVWFENSAHAPNFEEPAAFAEAMRQLKAEVPHE